VAGQLGVAQRQAAHLAGERRWAQIGANGIGGKGQGQGDAPGQWSLSADKTRGGGRRSTLFRKLPLQERPSMTAHPLDRPVWNALTSRQAHLAEADPGRCA